MIKKILILAVVLGILAIAYLPMYSSNLAERAFNNPDSPTAQEDLKKAVELKKWFYMYDDARLISEKAIILFPESGEWHIFHVFSAAVCAEQGRHQLAALHWYKRFVELYPDHELAARAKQKAERLKMVNEGLN